MSRNKYRFPLLILAFVLLIVGAILQYNNHLTIAWIFIGIAIVIYLTARIFMRDKKPKKESSAE